MRKFNATKVGAEIPALGLFHTNAGSVAALGAGTDDVLPHAAGVIERLEITDEDAFGVESGGTGDTHCELVDHSEALVPSYITKLPSPCMMRWYPLLDPSWYVPELNWGASDVSYMTRLPSLCITNMLGLPQGE